jgi:hypothetical protein
VVRYHLVMGLLLRCRSARWLAGLEDPGHLGRVGYQPCPDRPALAGAGALRAVGSHGFATLEWGVIAVDQALHLSILAMLAVLLG